MNRFVRRGFSAGVLLILAVAARAESWRMASPRAWSREAGAARLTVCPDGSFELRHAGAQDWAVHGVGPIAVTGGDVFRLRCASDALPDAPDAQPYALCAILRDAKGEILSWTYGFRSASPGAPAVAEFMVPPGGARLEPRVIGNGRTGVRVKGFVVESLGNRLPKAGSVPASVDVETPCLKVSVSGTAGAIAVTDRRTGRTWTPETFPAGSRFVTALGRVGSAIALELIDAGSLQTFGAIVTPCADLPELLVTVTGEGEMPSEIDYPPAFASRKGERLIIPMNEGIGFPVDEPDGVPARLPTYSGHGLCMSFFGVQDDASGAGCMGIVETADDAAVAFRRAAADAPVAPGVIWEPQKGRFGEARRLRYVFFGTGGYVAMCKRYRERARREGKLRTFAEKAKARPLVERLLGSPNVWCWERDKVAMAKDLKAAGIDRFLWSAGGTPEEVAALAKMDGVLVSRYDVYRDIYRPEQLAKLGWKNGTNTDAWPDGAAWDSADSNDWRKAWGVKAKDGTWTYCGCMCDAVSAKFCRRHVGEELKRFPYNTRFIDVTTAAAWDTCSNPAHPMTRTDSRRFRMDLLRLLGDEYGLVVGSETGHDAAVPYCDYFEGMLSLCSYRVPDSGRNIHQIWTNVPPHVAKFQVGAAYRLPLWELVYHDCLCAHWYWGDYNNKLPALWDRRDLFNALYGTMGMYMFTRRQWERDKDRFVRSFKSTSPIARRTGFSEMLDHRILSPDRLVQRSVFADGTTVTVNFGEKPFALPEGGELAGGRIATRN